MNVTELWSRVEQVVSDNAAALRAMCTSGELYGWAVEQGMVGPILWPIVRTELMRQIGVDWEEMHAKELDRFSKALRAEAAESRAIIELYAAGSDDHSVYAVCDVDGRPIVCRHFHAEDRFYQRGDQLSADMSAAEKAVWLAGKACAAAGAASCAMTLHVASLFIEPDILAPLARRWHIWLDLDVRANNPAVQLCHEPEFRDWHEVSLANLVSRV
ncbi:hypothetical protein [Nocardia altamirensis]|uniref:hypothetical protein n=1 Tax=Nocardia altamirensis TaxID=472158 RepID=UPI0008403457|nr:hypothetical protein [Nocardia altamirensis]